jgi:hypothetical protein
MENPKREEVQQEMIAKGKNKIPSLLEAKGWQFHMEDLGQT